MKAAPTFDHDEAMRLLADGATCAAVARRFGVSRSRIWQIASARGIAFASKRSEIDRRDGAIIVQIAKGKRSYCEIASSFGVTSAVVANLAREQGFYIGPRGIVKRDWGHDEINKILSLRSSHSAREIAAMFGCTRNAIIGLWNRHADRSAAP